MFPVQTPLGAWQGLGNHSFYEAPNKVWVEHCKTSEVISIREEGLSPSLNVQSWSWSKKKQKKKKKIK